MKKILVIMLIAAFSSFSAKSQSMGRTYKTALGVKVWNGGGVTFKSFITSQHAIEVIGYFYKQGSRFTGLYEFHGDIEGADGLKWYAGPGVHIGFYNKKYVAEGTIIGLDGVLGLDYKINNAPINISLDWQPSFEFGDNRGFLGSWGGLGVRYTF